METDENTAENHEELQPPPATPTPDGCYVANLILNAIVALVLGVGIVLIMNVLNHAGWFSLLSGLFGAVLYIAWVFPRLLFGPAFVPPRQRPEVINAIRQQQQAEETGGREQMTPIMIYRGMAVVGIIGIAAFIGISFLPSHGAMFALLSAVLSILVCVSGFMLGLGILLLFISHRQRVERGGTHFDL